MATRDRTEEFMQLRGARARTRLNDGGSGGLLQPDTNAVYVKPLWVTKMEGIRQIQKNITEKQSQLESMQKSHLKVQFGATRDEEGEEIAVEQATAAINGLFKSAEQGIKDLEAVFLSEVDDSGGTDAELTLLRNVKMCLANDIAQQTRGFGDNQRRYLRDVQKQKSVRAKGADSGQRAVQDELAKDAMIDGYRQQGMTQDQIEMIMENREQVDERVREFENIASSIKTLHEMFQDLNTMVIEQGSVLDRVDANMQLTHQRVTRGRQELQKAQEHQNAGCFKLIVLFLAILILGLILALIAKIL